VIFIEQKCGPHIEQKWASFTPPAGSVSSWNSRAVSGSSDVLLDQVHRHVAGALDHHLDIVVPGDRCELTKRVKFRKLGLVVRVSVGAGAETVAQRGDFARRHDLADPAKTRIEGALPPSPKWSSFVEAGPLADRLRKWYLS